MRNIPAKLLLFGTFIIVCSLTSFPFGELRSLNNYFLSLSESHSGLGLKVLRSEGLSRIRSWMLFAYQDDMVSTNFNWNDARFSLGLETSQQPTRIRVAAVGIDTSVVESPVVHGYWEVSAVAANHGKGSGYPGENGNVVIFAHARTGLFGNLYKVNKGDLVYVFTAKTMFLYIVDSIMSVDPDQVRVIRETKNEQLTLFTCSGDFDEKRLIVTAKPLKNLLSFTY